MRTSCREREACRLGVPTRALTGRALCLLRVQGEMEALNASVAAAELVANEAELQRMKNQLLDEVDAAGERKWGD